MKKLLNISFKIIKWLNCWQSYLSILIIGFILIFLNENFLFIIKENKYQEYYLNEIQYILFGYFLLLFLGGIHYSKTKNGISRGGEYISFIELVKLQPTDYPKILMILIVVPMLGLMYKWMYIFIWLIFILFPLKLIGIDIVFKI